MKMWIGSIKIDKLKLKLKMKINSVQKTANVYSVWWMYIFIQNERDKIKQTTKTLLILIIFRSLSRLIVLFLSHGDAARCLNNFPFLMTYLRNSERSLFSVQWTPFTISHSVVVLCWWWSAIYRKQSTWTHQSHHIYIYTVYVPLI